MALKIKLNFSVLAMQLDETPFKESFAGENGEPEQRDLYLGKILASNLVNATDNDDLYKMTDWGRSVYKGEILELDMQDAHKLKKNVEAMKGLSKLLKRQLLDVIDAGIDEAKAQK